MPTSHTSWTVEMLHELPDDGNRYEILKGALLVSPAPSWLHQRAVGELHYLLKAHAAGLELQVLMAPAAVSWDPQTELQPDLLVVPSPSGGSTRREASASTGWWMRHRGPSSDGAPVMKSPKSCSRTCCGILALHLCRWRSI